MLTSSASSEASSRENCESFSVRSSCTLCCTSCCTSALPACRTAQACNISQPMAKKWTYLCAFQCRSEIGVVGFVSCWTAAAAEPHVDHAASAVCSSPSPVDVGPAAMDAYTSQSRVRRIIILGQESNDYCICSILQSWQNVCRMLPQSGPLASNCKTDMCMGSSNMQICSRISSQPPPGACS